MPFRPDHPAYFVTPRAQRLQFIGTGGEYSRIGIVNLLLSVITLGIYSAWAKVRRESYFCAHTLFAGSPFRYHGQPKAILKGRILAVLIVIGFNVVGQFAPLYSLLFLPVFLVAIPWAVRTSLRFKAANTSWRGIHFTFTGSLKESFVVIYGWGILNILTLGLTLPASIRRWHKYIFNNLSLGGTKFNADPDLRGYYEPFVIPAVLVLGSVAVIIMTALNGAAAPTERFAALKLIIGGLIAAIYLILPLLFFAYVNVRIRNHLFDNILLGHHGLASDMRARGMLWLLLKHGPPTLLSLGLYLPVLRVALARYRVEHLQVYPAGDIENFVTERLDEQRALGEELTDVLDMDLGL